MEKIFKDYLLEGGVKGRRFVDHMHRKSEPIIYKITNIKVLMGAAHRYCTMEGIVLKTGETYLKEMNFCLLHPEYEMTQEEQIRESFDGRR